MPVNPSQIRGILSSRGLGYSEESDFVKEPISSMDYPHIYTVSPSIDTICLIGVTLNEQLQPLTQRAVNKCVIIADDIDYSFDVFVEVVRKIAGTDEEDNAPPGDIFAGIYRQRNVVVIKGARLRNNCPSLQVYEHLLHLAGKRLRDALVLNSGLEVVWHNNENPDLLLHCLQTPGLDICYYAITAFQVFTTALEENGQFQDLMIRQDFTQEQADLWALLICQASKDDIPLATYSEWSLQSQGRDTIRLDVNISEAGLTSFFDLWLYLVPKVFWRPLLDELLNGLATFHPPTLTGSTNKYEASSLASDLVRIHKDLCQLPRKATSAALYRLTTTRSDSVREVDMLPVTIAVPKETDYRLPPFSDMHRNPSFDGTVYYLVGGKKTGITAPHNHIRKRWDYLVECTRSGYNKAMRDAQYFGMSEEVALKWAKAVSGHAGKKGALTERLLAWKADNVAALSALSARDSSRAKDNLNAVREASEECVFSVLARKTLHAAEGEVTVGTEDDTAL
ncbi:uncharacterized protein K452DRAFT_340768 [Aplosporella prunicola CBS 121167]|uniref:Uncharacterized protein n=1 Tax=Aplosporella prunicola CBS 121167 TaxID=1176127 RepID=A0A6A6BRR6_9PEZI|nr:uncharacterized protein K452DRAFT_340768 [Aplosporella prunicola CBS 121167]KAF2146163.1 hypothetical protein K452DRAFT_340768 [Aplosporella prunicola CBS 121167]